MEPETVEKTEVQLKRVPSSQFLLAEEEKPNQPSLGCGCYPSSKLDLIFKSVDECPAYLGDNEFVFAGYRVNYTVVMCLQSLFKLHNETWNIWTHIFGFLLFFVLTFITPLVILEEPTPWDIFIFSIFLVAAQCHMLFSAVFHTFNCYSSPKCYEWRAKLDYCGISIMIVGSYYPPLYYGFSCYRTLKIVYLFVITLFGVVGITISSFQIFSTARFRVARACFYIAFGLFAVIPMPHLSFLIGIKVTWSIIWRESIVGACYITGAIVYMSRIPERWRPGKFDISFASSHVLWHYFTIVAAMVSYFSCLYIYSHQSDWLAPCSSM